MHLVSLLNVKKTYIMTKINACRRWGCGCRWEVSKRSWMVVRAMLTVLIRRPRQKHEHMEWYRIQGAAREHVT